MGRKPCCWKAGLTKGAWTSLEDETLINYVNTHGANNWSHLPRKAGLHRCGKSCRLRWLNYLKPDIKRGYISPDEDDLIIKLHNLLGNRWSLIAGRLPGRTDNEIKNHWKTRLSKTILNKDHEVIRTRAVWCTRAINIPHPLDRHSQMQNPHQDHKHDSDGVSVNVHDSAEAAQDHNKDSDGVSVNVHDSEEAVQDHNNDSDGVSVNVNDSAEAAQDHNNDSDGVSVNVHDSAEAADAGSWMSSLDQQMGAMDLTDLASFLNSDDDQWFHQ